MLDLASYFDEQVVVRAGGFLQTQFANTDAPHSICYAVSARYLKIALENDNIVAVIVPASLVDRVPDNVAVVVAENPEREFYQLHNRLVELGKVHQDFKPEIADSAVIHPSAIVDDLVQIAAGVEIGAGAIVHSYSVLEEGVKVGPGAIIGAEGHYYKRYEDGLLEVKHAGGVHLKAGSQVLAGAIVSKALHSDFTIVGCETVVSVSAHIGHGCKIGARCTITGNVQISGYTVVGDDVWMGPSSTIGNLLTIGDGARIEIGSVVISDVASGQRVSGNFAINHRENFRQFASSVKK